MVEVIVEAAAILALAVTHAASAQTSAAPRVSFQTIEMDPASPSTLHNNDHVYLRIKYEATEPMRVLVQLFDRGTRTTKAYTNGQLLLEPGEGHVMSWFAFTGAGFVDSIRVSATASGGDIVTSQDLTVNYVWDGQRSTGETRAPWVGPLLAEQEQRQRAAFAEMEKRGAGGFGSVFGMLAVSLFGVVALGAIAACVAWPLRGIIRWEGGWRAAAAVPLAAIVLWGLKDAYDLMIDRTSHNLLPFEFIIAACAIVPYMVVATLVRHVRLKHHRRRAPLS